MTLYLLKYNNYYNRILKKFDTINEYSSFVLAIFENINFNPSDGIQTEQIVNYDGEMPDYLIAVDETDTINSRWFITESHRTRSQQFKIFLLRDVIADWYNDVIDSPTFIEKALLSRNDPAIFNNENMTFNQIKTTETAIKDLTESAWYVLYLNKELEETTISLPTGNVVVSGIYTNQENYPFDKYTRNGSEEFAIPTDDTYCLLFHNRVGDSFICGWDSDGNAKTPVSSNVVSGGAITISCSQYKTRDVGFTNKLLTSATEIGQDVAEVVSRQTTDWTAPLYSSGDYKTDLELDSFLNENGKIYQFGNEYKQVVIREPSELERREYIIYPSSPYANAYATIAQEASTLESEYSQYYAVYQATPLAYYIDYLPISIESISFAIPTNKKKCEDAPYDLMLLPYHSVKFGDIQSSGDLSRRIVNQIINTLTDNRQLFDAQVLPYVPLPNSFLDTGEVRKSRFTNTENVVYYQEITGAAEGQTFVIYASQSNISKNIIGYQIPVPIDTIEFKVSNETDMYRLVSPNYNGQFEFSATKNNGVAGYSLSLSCKPINPYIRLAPAFNSLYGRDFGDARGLICSGDFSLFRIDDAWNTYELNNKNYQQIFNRQIENMEVNNSIQMTNDILTAATGTLQGMATTGTAGALMGGVVGGAVGAVVGGITSAAAGVGDVLINRKLRQEALDFTKDQFGYNLRNIKAVPYSLSKVTALTPDNKLFPVLEYYTCTTVEKEALRSKIRYNGMTVMRIGTISQFILPESIQYIKGKIIRLPESLAEDYHVAAFIAEEINKGVFI